MANLNQVIIAGNLTKDPVQFDYKKNGKPSSFAVLMVAVNTRKGDTTYVEYISVKVFNGQVKACMGCLKKGSGVLVSGHLVNNNYTDKDGIERWGMDVFADKVQFTTAKASK